MNNPFTLFDMSKSKYLNMSVEENISLMSKVIKHHKLKLSIAKSIIDSLTDDEIDRLSYNDDYYSDCRKSNRISGREFKNDTLIIQREDICFIIEQYEQSINYLESDLKEIELGGSYNGEIKFSVQDFINENTKIKHNLTPKIDRIINSRMKQGK